MITKTFYTICLIFTIIGCKSQERTVKLSKGEITIPTIKEFNTRSSDFIYNFYDIVNKNEANSGNSIYDINNIEQWNSHDSIFNKFYNELNFTRRKCASFEIKDSNTFENINYKYDYISFNCEDNDRMFLESYLYEDSSKDRIIEIHEDRKNNLKYEIGYYRNGNVKYKGVRSVKYFEFPIGKWFFYNENGKLAEELNTDSYFILSVEDLLKILKRNKIKLTFDDKRYQVDDYTYLQNITLIRRYHDSSIGPIWWIEYSQTKNTIEQDKPEYNIVLIDDHSGKIIFNQKLETDEEVFKYRKKHQTDRLNVSRTVDGNFSVIIDEKKEIKLLLFDFEK